MIGSVLIYCSLLGLAAQETVDVRRPGSHAIEIIQLTKSLSIGTGISRKSILHGEGDSLDQIILRASRSFLELRNDEAWAATELGMNLITASAPYSEMKQDLIDVVSLQTVIAEEVSDKNRHPALDTLSQDLDFLEKLPYRLQNQLRNSKIPDRVLKNSDISPIAIRVWINGEEKTLPRKINLGKYFIHWLDSEGDLSAAYVFVTSKKIDLKRVWIRNLWATTSDQEVLKLMERQNTSFSALKIPASVGPPRIIRRHKIKQTAPLNNLSSDTKVIEAKTSETFWEQPWFWAITGAVLAGTGAYLIYESQQSTTIRTP